MKRPKAQGDPFERIGEAQDHRYDPGYFTGGRINPMLTGRRPNPYGWVLLIMGISFGVFFFFADSSDVEWWQRLLIWAFLLLNVAAGIRLLRPKRPKTARRGQ